MNEQHRGGEGELPLVARKLIEGAVAGGTAFAALVGPAEGIAAASNAPLVSEALSRAGAIVRQRWRRNTEAMLAEAQLEMDELLERLVETPARQELLFVRAVADLEAPHVQLLKILHHHPDHPETTRWAIPQLADDLSLQATAYPLMATLQRHGIIEQHQDQVASVRNLHRNAPAEVSWSITGFGLLILERLETSTPPEP